MCECEHIDKTYRLDRLDAEHGAVGNLEHGVALRGEAFVVLAPLDLGARTADGHADEDGSLTTDHVLVLRRGDDAGRVT